MGLQRRRTLGRYEILRLLANGGMAEVLLGRVRGPGGFERPVVLKRILPAFSGDSSFVDMFVDEARIIVRLDHPNVVHIHELGNADGELFMVMEYLHGDTTWALKQRLAERGETLAPHLVAFIVAEACAGLHAAHELRDEHGANVGVVHRDVSPQNIFVTFEGCVKVIDFGIAKAKDCVAAHTEVGLLKGKLSYMAPEQCASQEVDRRADVFALGAVMYELMTLRSAFKRDAPAATIRAIMTEPIAAPSEIAACPPALERVCLRALERDPARRYPTALEMRRDLVTAMRELTSDLPAEDLASVMRDLFADQLQASGALAQADAPPDVETQIEPAFTRYATAIIGRRKELAAIRSAVDGGARIITLLGLGGVGKTRLATAFAELYAKEHAVVYADVASSRSSADLCSAMARALGVRADESPHEPLARRVGEILERRGSVLVVIDNFEQLARDATQSVCAWIGAAPQAMFIITSRRPLGVDGEHMIAIGPLDVPAKDVEHGASAYEESEAVQLFIARARTRAHGALSERDADVVVDLVRRLDGLPLAIELAAARLDVLPLSAVAARLAERFSLLQNPLAKTERHGTMFQALEWSWELLEPWQRTALAQLSLFESSFRLEDAEAVLERESALDALHALVRHSLARSDSAGEFSLLDTVREYAAGKLAPNDEARARHARHFVDRGFEMLADFDGRGALATDLERHRDDLTAIIRRAIERKDAQEAARALVALGPAQAMRSPADERVARIDEVLALEHAASDMTLRLVHSRAIALRECGRIDDALAAIDDGLAHARTLALPKIEAMLLEEASACEIVRGHLERAREHADRALAVARAIGDRRREGRAHYRHAVADIDLGDFDLAAQHGSRALDVFRAMGDVADVTVAHFALGASAFEQGDLERAEEHMKLAASTAREAGERRQEAVAIGYLGGIAHDREQWELARDEYEKARAAFARIAERRLEAIYAGYVGIVEAQRGNLDAGEPAIERARAALAKIGDARYVAAMDAAHVGVRALRGDTKGAYEALARIQASVVGRGSTHLAGVVEVYRGVIEAIAGDVASAEERAATYARAQTEDTRLALPFLRRAIRDAKERARTWTFDERGLAFRAPSSAVVRLDTREPLARIMASLVRQRLARPNVPLEREDLVAAAWPDEAKMSEDSAKNRIKVAVSTLRKAGLEPLLVTRGSGYLLDPTVPIRVDSI